MLEVIFVPALGALKYEGDSEPIRFRNLEPFVAANSDSKSSRDPTRKAILVRDHFGPHNAAPYESGTVLLPKRTDTSSTICKWFNQKEDILDDICDHELPKVVPPCCTSSTTVVSI